MVHATSIYDPSLLGHPTLTCFVLLPPSLRQGMSANFGVLLNAVSAVNAVAIMGLADEYVNYIMRAFELEDGPPMVRHVLGCLLCPPGKR